MQRFRGQGQLFDAECSGLPAGLTMTDGTISGTPAESVTFRVSITLSNNTKSDTKSLKLKIAAAGNTSAVRNGHALEEYVIVA